MAASRTFAVSADVQDHASQVLQQQEPHPEPVASATWLFDGLEPTCVVVQPLQEQDLSLIDACPLAANLDMTRKINSASTYTPHCLVADAADAADSRTAGERQFHDRPTTTDDRPTTVLRPSS